MSRILNEYIYIFSDAKEEHEKSILHMFKNIIILKNIVVVVVNILLVWLY